MTLTDNIKRLAQQIQPDLVQIRRQIHQYPELSFQELKTSEFVQQELKKINVHFLAHFAKTGVVGFIESTADQSKKQKCIALRADMDALPLQELVDWEAKSRVENVMHACGHDAHVAMVLGAARILSEMKEELRGKVKFIFQPGEEKNPGGAKLMVKEGILENPKVDAIYCLHVDPQISSGAFGMRYGTSHAQPDEIYISILGKGGHGAYPHLAIDPIVIGAQVILALQTIPSRLVNPLEPVVVTIGKFAGGHTTNVIPDKVELAGTVRTFNATVAKQVHKMIEDILRGITSLYGASYDLKIDPGYPVLENDPNTTIFAHKVLQDYAGKEKVTEIPPAMGGEDFSFYTQKVPGSIINIGTRNEAKDCLHSIHSPKFKLDEDILSLGAGALASLAVEWLRSESG
jgi:amidohydrolase